VTTPAKKKTPIPPKKPPSKKPPKPAQKAPHKKPVKAAAKKKPAAPVEERFDTPEALARQDAESHQLITAKRREVAELKAAALAPVPSGPRTRSFSGH
jgi:hypothetical protein